MIITNSRYALVGYFITSYPTRAHETIVIYSQALFLLISGLTEDPAVQQSGSPAFLQSDNPVVAARVVEKKFFDLHLAIRRLLKYLFTVFFLSRVPYILQRELHKCMYL